MLLYQLSQWLDERQRLQQELRLTGADNEAFFGVQNRIHDLEERLYSRAREWSAAHYVQPAASSAAPDNAALLNGTPYEPPVLLDTEPELP
ncbi:hypothetical protein ACFFK0_18890 [Paenibacillus chartarius]|uniref:Uncharacterized protein n=1 Tax=Paenibacillus chartarius TaxID=747481 RepID=A0ABV6DPD9_9BACL